MIMRGSVVDPKNVQLIDQMKCSFMINTLLVERLGQASITGWVGIQEMKGMTIAHIASFSPALGKKAMTIWQVGETK